MVFPKKVRIVELAIAPFRCAKDAVAWAKDHGIVGVMSDTDTNVDANENTKAYSYEISNIEVLKGNAGDMPLPSDKTSIIGTDILLTRLSTFASKTPADAGVLLVGLHYIVVFAASAASPEIFGGGWAGNVSPSRSSRIARSGFGST